jgi:6-pyruvoyltetrahydropterin/6-carboxytetrahydropterin synthase
VTGVHEIARYEVGTAVEMRALHVMPGVEGPEGELHAHDYRPDVVVGRADLGDRGMVCDLDALDAALTGVADRLHDHDLEAIRPPDAEAATVEVFARCAGLRVARAFGAYRAPVS